MDLHGMAIPQTPQAGRAGLFKERSFLGMDVQELTSLTVCNQRHSRDSGQSAGRYSISEHLLGLKKFFRPLSNSSLPIRLVGERAKNKLQF
jgi:hypothetical protein